jgi:hypothetical protein
MNQESIKERLTVKLMGFGNSHFFSHKYCQI